MREARASPDEMRQRQQFAKQCYGITPGTSAGWRALKEGILYVSSVHELPRGGSDRIMKKNSSKAAEPGMRAEYSFNGGARGKYSERFAEGSNVVVLEPDVAEAFPTSEEVNEALRALASAQGHAGNAGK